jgi:hypothetical protein
VRSTQPLIARRRATGFELGQVRLTADRANHPRPGISDSSAIMIGVVLLAVLTLGLAGVANAVDGAFADYRLIARQTSSVAH